MNHQERTELALQGNAEAALKDLTVEPVLKNSIACLTAHAMQEEQPDTFLLVLTQLCVTYSMDPSITKEESVRAMAIYNTLVRRHATKEEVAKL